MKLTYIYVKLSLIRIEVWNSPKNVMHTYILFEIDLNRSYKTEVSTGCVKV